MGKGSQNSYTSLESASQENAPIGVAEKYYDWEEIRKHNKKTDLWIVVNDIVYDVTKFQQKHPGGNKLLEYYGGQDATEVFNAFHKEFDRVYKLAKYYKIGTLNSSNQFTKENEIKRDFEEIRNLAFKKGFFKPSNFFYFLHGFQILFLHVLGYYILWHYAHNLLAVIFAGICQIIAQGQASWIQHDYGHSSLFAKPKYNRYLQGLFLGWVKGASPEWWTLMHNQHHSKPNVINRDPDVRVDPLLVLGNVQPLRVK
jgi:fatty acid desaturase 2 (delta-6 desaturase)